MRPGRRILRALFSRPVVYAPSCGLSAAALPAALLVCTLLPPHPARAQPTPLVQNVRVERVATLAPGTLRLERDAATGALFTLTLGGDVYRFDSPYTTGVRVASTAAHGLSDNVQGLAVGAGGTLYLVGNVLVGLYETGVVRRGVPVGSGDGSGGYTWTTVAQTETFVRSGTPSDHKMNAVAVSPDGAWLFVNHGSRTDHGEERSNGGAAPGLREIPLTSLLYRLPATATGLVLPNDEAALRAGGYLWADGLRNAFDLAFDASGRLYATENSGDRDDSDELNWVREGRHYGFPWRMGVHDTPQRFPGYDPAADRLLNPAATSAQAGAFYDDPGYPAVPLGVVFTDPVVNVGPDADAYRDEATGQILRASATGVAARTFTPHRSPLGLTFDGARALPLPFTGDGFVLSFTDGDAAHAGASELLTPFGEPSQDLLHLRFSGPDTLSATRIVGGFDGPIDAVLDGQTMYVAEIGARSGLWAVTFSLPSASAAEAAPRAGVRVLPNPFRARARVEVETARAQDVRVEVVDVLGRRVALLHDGALGAGAHAFEVRGTDLPAGLYLVRVATSGSTVTRTLLHAR